MQGFSDISGKTEIENFPRHKILVTNDEILISDPPFAWRIFLALSCFGLFIFALKYKIGSRYKFSNPVNGKSMQISFTYKRTSTKIRKATHAVTAIRSQ